MTVLVRTYDDRSEAPQPSGPVQLDIPEDATDEQIAEQIRRQLVEPLRPATVERHDSFINQGWAIVYRAEPRP